MLKSYSLLVIPFIALFVTQLIKVIIDARNKKFSWQDLNSYGGMPSSHAALLSAALVQAVQLYTFKSQIVAVIAIITFITLRDAVGLRMIVGKHSKVLNSLIKELPSAKEDKYPEFETRVGHTYTQIFVGLIVGAVIALLL